MAQKADLTFFKGEDIRLSFTMLPVVNITGWTIVFTMKASPVATTALITQTATIDDGPNGAFSVALTHAQTDAIAPGHYAYEAVRADLGSEVVLARGDIICVVTFPTTAWPYVSIDDVQARLPQLPLSTTSKPSLVGAIAFIEDMVAELSAELIALGYDITVNPTTLRISWPIYRNMIAQGVIAKILDARAAAVGGDAAMKSATAAQKEFDARLTRLRDRTQTGTFEFADWPRTGKAATKPSTLLALVDATIFDQDEAENWPSSRRATMGMIF
jgi:hypothetical protein